MSGHSDPSSETRLVDFSKFLATKLLTKVAQIDCWIIGLFWKSPIRLLCKNSCGYFLCKLQKNLPTVSLNIWSHWFRLIHRNQGAKDVGSRVARAKLNFSVWRVASVTRFGEISPLWQHIKNLSPFHDGLFSIWQNINLPFQILNAMGENFNVESCQIFNS